MGTRKAKTAVVCAIGVGLLWAAVSNAAERGLDRIRKTGELRVGVSGEQPPLNMTNASGELIGMEIDLMRVLAQSLGVEAAFVKLPFGDLLAALDADKVDLVMSGMTITPARMERAAFVGPYHTSGKTILTKNAKLAAAESVQRLAAQNPRLVVLAASTSEVFARKHFDEVNLEVTVTLEAAIDKVLRGRVDLLVADRETCTFTALRYAEQGLVVRQETFTVEPIGIAVPLEEPRFADLLEHYLSALRESGALQKTRAAWFEDTSWMNSMP